MRYQKSTYAFVYFLRRSLLGLLLIQEKDIAWAPSQCVVFLCRSMYVTIMNMDIRGKQLEMIIARAVPMFAEMVDPIRIAHDDLALTNLRNQLRCSIYEKTRASVNITSLMHRYLRQSPHTRRFLVT